MHVTLNNLIQDQLNWLAFLLLLETRSIGQIRVEVADGAVNERAGTDAINGSH